MWEAPVFSYATQLPRGYVTIEAPSLADRLAALRPTRTPWPPWPSPKELAARIEAGGDVALRDVLAKFELRERLIREARSDPFRCGWEWGCWDRADTCLPIDPIDEPDPRTHLIEPATPYRVLVVLGGNRASKTEWAVKRVMQTLARFPRTKVVCMAQKVETSIQVQQEYFWRYFPNELRELNNKRDPHSVFLVKYQTGRGFTDQKFVLPNGSSCLFLVYTQDVRDYEGIQVGCPDQPGAIGWYCDESLPLDWLRLLRTRAATMDACGLWTFTPLHGMTLAIKETLGNGTVLESALEPALAGRATLPGLPPGHMPTIQQGAQKDIAVLYFHTRENPLGGYERVKAGLAGKPWYMLERALCGYTRDTRGRLFTTFGAANVVPEAAVPTVGTVFMHIDPHSARNWFCLWLIVDPQGRIFAYDEWPDEPTYGEWAVATERNPQGDGGQGWDGDVGPAQHPVGYGVLQYKQMILSREAGRPVPHRRTIDRRAGPAPQLVGSGPSTCLYEELNKEQDFAVELAGGAALEQQGLDLIKEALWYDPDKSLDPMTNYPRLFVSEKCVQLRWALDNFTGRDGPRGACKDPIDCLRDMFTSGLQYVPPFTYGSYGGGSY